MAVVHEEEYSITRLRLTFAFADAATAEALVLIPCFSSNSIAFALAYNINYKAPLDNETKKQSQ
jgi:hypothetical protein